jgi:UDP-glucose 4-epimerase
VDEIAGIIADELGAKPRITHTGGKKGWVGDVAVMLLDTKKLEKLGWKEKVNFEKGVRAYVRWIAASKSKSNKK